MNCAACGTQTPRLRLAQRYCPPCEARITDTIRKDEERRKPRFARSKDLTGAAR
jgi:hypothetical protein